MVTYSQTLLPSPCTVEDGNQLLQKLYGKEDQFFIAETVVAHQEFLKSCVDIFKPLLQEKAKKVNELTLNKRPSDIMAVCLFRLLRLVVLFCVVFPRRVLEKMKKEVGNKRKEKGNAKRREIVTREMIVGR